jgi:hypothetical protein
MTIEMNYYSVKEEELDVLALAPVWVILLVAGADGNIDRKEKQEALSIMQRWCDCIGPESPDLWRDVVQNFETNIRGYQMLLPSDPEKRNEVLVSKINRLNDFIDRLDRAFADRYVAFLRDLANRVATASGGFFRYRTTQAESDRFAGLPMIAYPHAGPESPY